jgi:two-component system LytT family sensor kinase
VVVTLTYYLIISFDNISKKNINEAKLENMLRETELMMLRSQINPHFLFNSLNSVSSLTVTNPEKAREMVVKLSEFMRYALSRKEEKVVSLEKELLNMRLYMEIEKVRFGDRLILEENVVKDDLNISIPNMILQPLYENAVKHGVYESIESVVITINISKAHGGLLIQIINDYDPENIPVRGTGTGLKNVHRRLDLYYNKQAYLNTMKENGKFTAELFIPKS